jgi:hypothetical protein
MERISEKSEEKIDLRGRWELTYGSDPPIHKIIVII